MSESVSFGIMANCTKTMDKVFLWGGRILFLVLMVTQCLFLASYPAIYKNNLTWYLTSLSYAPAAFTWLFLLLSKKAKLRWLFLTWGLYLIGLVGSIVIVFTTVGDILDKERFLGPNGLKMTLCITPLLVLLLLNTAEDAERHEKLLPLLCFQMAVDLVDTIEIIDIVLDEKEHNYGIPNAFGHSMVAIACVSFLLSLCKMLEIDLNTGEPKPKRALLRYVFEMALVNLVFLIIRSVIFIKYKKDESIFILKNLIAIILGIMGIRNLKRKMWLSSFRCK